ncbi:SDR family oxidoreductase [Microbispora cellulosiformans]|uniref:SDR family oxidoreductase n=1 Tax=Microbispora cellulosiformans TaxID=2614688 RepID=A0A5J5K825_9ACTN|nr:SDR family NAD(P)-dependent oxidoreductase [Microbispora cellulosiformans]KAA9380811.1 SDR family oxidoreductase [Microbispora cellulosiformans]
MAKNTAPPGGGPASTVTLVTGGAQGIGRGVAAAFREAGSKVVIADVDEARAAETAAGLSGVSWVRMDVRDPASVAAATAEAAARHGGLDTLVACAGVYPNTPLPEMDPAEWDEVFAVNVRGVMLAAREFARTPGATGTGRRIIAISSGAARSARVGAAHYCASKAALEMLVKVLALELAPSGTTVNAVAPGLIEVPATAALAPEYIATLVAGQPVHRMGTPAEVARACLFLADPGSSFITGSVLDVDGGFLAGTPLPPS